MKRETTVIRVSRRLIAAAASEPEANERGSSLISRRLRNKRLNAVEPDIVEQNNLATLLPDLL